MKMISKIKKELYGLGYRIHKDPGKVYKTEKNQPTKIHKVVLKELGIKIDGESSVALWSIWTKAFVISKKLSDFIFAYNAPQGSGCQTCMSNPPDGRLLYAYTSGDFQVAYIFDKGSGEITGRAVCNAKNKTYSTSYGTSILNKCLSLLGYERKDFATIGCRLRIVQDLTNQGRDLQGRDKLLYDMVAFDAFVPYVDNGKSIGAGRFIIKNGYFVVCHPEELRSFSTYDGCFGSTNIISFEIHTAVEEILLRCEIIDLCEKLICFSESLEPKRKTGEEQKEKIKKLLLDIIENCKNNHQLSLYERNPLTTNPLSRSIFRRSEILELECATEYFGIIKQKIMGRSST